MEEKKILSLSTNCKGQECAIVASGKTQRCVRPTVARAPHSSDASWGLGSRFGHLSRTHWAPAICAFHQWRDSFLASVIVLMLASRPLRAARAPRAVPRPSLRPSLQTRACGWKGLSEGGVPLGPLSRRPLSPLTPHGS